MDRQHHHSNHCSREQCRPGRGPLEDRSCAGDDADIDEQQRAAQRAAGEGSPKQSVGVPQTVLTDTDGDGDG
jgi:hypothetical protein